MTGKSDSELERFQGAAVAGDGGTVRPLPFGKHATVLLGGLAHYLLGRKTPPRILCDDYLARMMPRLSGKVVELGGRKRFNYRSLATSASDYIVTNIEDDLAQYDEYANVLDLPYPDGSVDGFVCVALLEHVPDPKKALSEVQRCLRPGGRCLLVVPAMFPRNPAPEEYFRFSPTALVLLLDKSRLLDLTVLGGLLTLNALALRGLFLRPIGIVVYLLDVVFGMSNTCNSYPVLIGVLAEKRV